MNRRIFYLLFIALSLAIGNAKADTAAASEKSSEQQGWSGLAGVGPMIFSKYTGGTGTQTWLLPLISANYDEIFYIDPLRANVYLGSTDDKKMAWGLAVEPRMGFHASDGARLAGMATRRNSLEGGFNFDWDADIIAISFSYFTDLTHSSNGTSSRLYLYKDVIKNEKWKLGANVGLDHMSAKVTNYFFGTTANEVTVNRPLYQPGSATNVVFGFDGSYKINQRYSILFGLQATHLNGSAANSPIVETKQSKVGWIGLAWNL
ncbi:MAG TPA: MipA/OmpV family protein [Burkholderiaceae bacterium]